MKKIELPKEQIKAIIDYYLAPHSLRDTSSFFNLNRPVIKRILSENNIELHSAELCAKLNLERSQAGLKAKYGEDIKSIFQLEEFKEKSKQTCLEKYGTEYSSQSDNNKVKSAETKRKRYGNKNFNNRAKAKQTCLEKYGVESYAQTDAFKQAITETCLALYGVKNGGGSQKAIQKIKASWRNKSESELIEIQKKHWRHYKADDNYFDSFPELCFFLYHKAAGEDISRCSTSFSYTFAGESFRYFPDFVLNGEVVEIKSDYLWQKMQIENTRDNAKYLCMLENNVKILCSKEYKKYINWFLSSGIKIEDFIVKDKEGINDI